MPDAFPGPRRTPRSGHRPTRGRRVRRDEHRRPCERHWSRRINDEPHPVCAVSGHSVRIAHFRGFLYTALAGRWSPPISVCGQTVLFTVWGTLIGATGSIDRIVLFAVFSALLGAIHAVTGSLWACMGFHTAFQVTAQLLTGNHWPQADLADPGGTISALVVAIPFLVTATLL
ncbi:CPBP family intramembrane metalloprotease [Nocardia flavorosea]|uniref:CPBP family intramembrane metalloprotease n=1 Tax=Nocardia flavorosea TaxID=53429 RepID=A0A846YRC0_9NOCA|nr:CPBP family intramembrane metalloprotease [Nocardia flavorosea]